MRVPPGTKIGRYTVESLLGSGGMGEVYLARDLELDRLVALKLLSDASRRDEEFRLRLRSEARAASALNHPNILTVHEVGESDGEHFIATEFVDGVTVRQKIGTLALVDIIRVVERTAEALAAAEAAGIVHRDVKPDNIMIRRDGYVKVLDFGLARRAFAEQQLHQTDTTALRGTIHYMSPEQLRGQPVDSRTDVWALGVVLYEMITGRRPFDGDHPGSIIAAILTAEAPPVAAPPAVRKVLTFSLAKDRKKRYPTMAAMLDDLRGIRREFESDSHPAAIAATQWSWESPAVAPVTSRRRRRASNLPVLLTTIVGRDEDIANVRGLFERDDARLVTITGPGGVGKTRLGLQIALEIATRFTDGAFFVSLSTTTEPDRVVDAIAAALGIREDAGGSLAATVERELQHSEMLLVLDNLEQVVDCGPSLSALLEKAADLRILATSQASLRVRGEVEYALSPLSVPAGPASVEALTANPAVALFTERARASDPRFTLNAENASAVADVCRRLDGLPLAIELAAARVKLMPPRAILARLSDPLAFLTGGPRDLPSRQQTMRGAIAWGYELLAPEEQRLLSLLGTFDGGFTLDAVEGVCNAVIGSDTSDLVGALVERSFVRREEPTGDEDVRFSLLGTIRDFARQQLASEPEATLVARLHAEWYAALADDAGEGLQGPEQKRSMKLIGRELANFETALQWSLAHRRHDLALRFAGSLWWYWYIRGHYGPGRRATEGALDIAPSTGEDVLRARAMLGAGVLAFLQCDYEIAQRHLEEAARVANAASDHSLAAEATQALGSIARERGQYERSLALHGDVLAHWKTTGNPTRIARSLNYIAFATWLSGDHTAAVVPATEALGIFEHAADGEGTAWSQINLAAAAMGRGDDEEAMALSKRALSTAQAIGFREGIAWSLNLLGSVSRRRGQPDRAEGFLRRSLRDHWELGDRWRSASVLEALAGVRLDEGDTLRGARLFAAARAIRERIGTPVPPAERPEVDAIAGSLADALQKVGDVSELVNAIVAGEVFERSA